MSQIAEETGIGRATLYKYFPDVESILVVWHERHIAAHLEQLAAFVHEEGHAKERLKAVLENYAMARHEHRNDELAALLHRGEHIERAHRRLHELIRDLLLQCVQSGDVRRDVPPDQLASYCVNALAAALELPSRLAVRRLVGVVLAGLRPLR